MDKRSKAVRVLGLLPNDPQAEEVALHALKDDKPGVPAAAAQALGDMKANSDYSHLGDLVNDKDAESSWRVRALADRAL